ncbi:luciferin 4-monooxygenase-like isoform X2 [Plodia interpunctella]|uniref:luciferin 4-monooxygenase-like isoform X2 n=1 Tax=Plodia interpunctella TaxID=58824 RepID=UPI002368ACCB|nr:luciferin 4-monooxygenase-like isoform X2 [Plodia interpunctella]
MDNIRIINKVVDGGPPFWIPANISFGQYVIDKLRALVKQGASLALINGETGQEITYQQLLQESVNIGSGLKKLGVRRGDVVALCSENRYEYLAAAIGVICRGAAVTTVNVEYTPDELKHVLNISKPNVIICSEKSATKNVQILKSLKYIVKIIQFDGSPVDKSVIPYSRVTEHVDEKYFEAEAVQGWSDVAYILYSSGTTGLPKGVMLSHLNVLYSAATFDNEDRVDSELIARLLTVVPWYHAYGLMSTINYLMVKKTLIYFSGFNPQMYLNAIQTHKANVLLAVPPIVVFLAKSPLVEKYDLSSVYVVMCGAAPLSTETISAASKRLPSCMGIFQGYGMTETSLLATKDLIDSSRKAGSAGYPVRGVKAKVVELDTRVKLGPNQKGEICLKGPIVMKGYAGDKAATRDMMDEEGFLKTGDIGYFDEEGCFFIVDRLKELIKYKGNQVPPAEVESVLLQHPGVAECGVVGAPHEAAGELPTAFVVLKPGLRLEPVELVDFAAKRIYEQKYLLRNRGASLKEKGRISWIILKIITLF